MSIVIKTERCVDGVTKCRKVVNLYALRREELSRDYFEGDPNIYYTENHGDGGKKELREDLDSEGEGIYTQLVLKQYSSYLEEDFQDRLSHIRDCASRLKDLSERRKRIEFKWSGGETYII